MGGFKGSLPFSCVPAFHCPPTYPSPTQSRPPPKPPAVKAGWCTREERLGTLVKLLTPVFLTRGKDVISTPTLMTFGGQAPLESRRWLMVLYNSL